ncbi:MAG: hypothetical protein DCC68_24605 [Planctomycetota bacterium]|nr:MAG: hypothetical protein DCC68_24605 [Planctomycetota bacterium]
MEYLRDRSIKTKLRWLTASTVVVALLIACAAFIADAFITIRRTKVEQVKTAANLLAANATATIEFQDQAAAADLLQSLTGLPSVQSACLFDERGAVFATYPRELATEEIPPFGNANAAEFVDSRFADVSYVIRRGDQRLGGLWIRATLDEIYDRVAHVLLIGVCAVVVAMGAAMVFASRLQRMLSRPITELAGAMERVRRGDCSQRVLAQGRDELGVLCDGFNSMLDQIEAAQEALETANAELENRVEARTAELTRTNADLLTARDAAEAASRAKSDFLANMSHEIRTPMTAILGFLELLEDATATPAERREYLRTIRGNGQHLLGVINDILDLSKIEAGKLDVERLAVPLCPLLSEVVSLMRGRAAARNLSLELRYICPIPESISTDPTRLRQILANLLGNAIKFTEQGRVELVVRLVEPVDEEHAQLAFDVIDTGVGMTGDQLQRVFQPFTQADESMTRRFGGTGLGLTISRRLARLLGGDIQVESKPKRGSTFTLTIDVGSLAGTTMLAECREAFVPLAAKAPVGRDHEGDGDESRPLSLPALPAVASLPLVGCRVLLAEDGVDNQRLINLLLHKAGAEVTIVENGKLALESALSAEAAGQPFDVLLTDMQMPVMDGYEAVRRLREAGYARPIIAVTAHAMRQDEQKCLDAGCDAYTSKPIEHAALIAAVWRFARKRDVVLAETATD